MTMLRTRIVLLSLLAALIAPAVAPCLQVGADAHGVMPCCRQQTSSAPSARECCVPEDRSPAVPAPTNASARLAAAPVAVVTVVTPVVFRRVPIDTPRHLSAIQPHLRFSVLLI